MSTSIPTPPKLLDQIRAAVRVRGYSLRTEETYVDWARRYILFHQKRHPRDMGASEVAELLAAWLVSPRAGSLAPSEAVATAVSAFNPSPAVSTW